LPDMETDAPTFTLPKRKRIAPSDDEIQSNPRARSAKLRVVIRTDAASGQAAAIKNKESA